MPFGFQIALDTLPSGTRATGTRSALAVSGFRLRARLGFSIPLCFPGQRGITPAFGYGAPHPSAEGTSTPLTHVLPSAHYGRFSRSALFSLADYVNQKLKSWIMRKYKRFRFHKTRASLFLRRLARDNKDLFVHWQAFGTTTFT